MTGRGYALAESKHVRDDGAERVYAVTLKNPAGALLSVQHTARCDEQVSFDTVLFRLVTNALILDDVSRDAPDAAALCEEFVQLYEEREPLAEGLRALNAIQHSVLAFRSWVEGDVYVQLYVSDFDSDVAGTAL